MSTSENLSAAPRATTAARLANSSDESPFVQAMDEYLSRLEAGEQPDRRKLLNRYPEHAEALGEFLDGLDFVHDVAPQLCTTSDGHASDRAMPFALGDFRILREIGRGGMGVVYEAEQLSLSRRVALKVLPYAAVLDKKQLLRFKNEAQAAAQLRHPHIVGVHFVGCERGVHYYAMELVNGKSLAELICDERQAVEKEKTFGQKSISRPEMHPTEDTRPVAELSTVPLPPNLEYFREVARLGVQGAQALEYAHDAGVVHRDIKPSNLLVDDRGHLWVTDFGLAMTQTTTGLTLTGDLLGTLRYMSPEQATGSPTVLDHRVDIYSLGVTLYELLTLRVPFASPNRQQLLRDIIEREPCPLRQIREDVPKDLETIVLKAMAKERGERYATALQLADDLKRYLDHKPIQAKRPTLLEKAKKWSRRHQALVATVALIALVAFACLAVGTALVTRQRNLARAAARETAVQKQIVEHQNRNIQLSLARAQLDRGSRQLEQGNFLGLLDLVEAWTNARHDSNLQNAVATLWAGWHQQIAGLLVTVVGHHGPVYDVAFSPSGTQLVTASADGTVRFWNPGNGDLLCPPLHHGTAAVRVLRFSPAGDLLATGAADGTVRLWNTSTFRAHGPIMQHGKGIVRCIVFSPDVTLLATGAEFDETARLWKTSTGEPHGPPIPQKDWAFDLQFSPDGKLLAVACNGNSFSLWDTARCQRHGPLMTHWSWVQWVQFSPDGNTLYTGSRENTVKSWATETGKLLGQVAQTPRLSICGLSPDGTLLATASTDRATHIWALSKGVKACEPIQDPGLVDALAFSPDSRLLATCSTDGAVRLWDANNGTPHGPALRHQGAVHAVAFSPDGALLATASDDGTARVWRSSSLQRITSLAGSGNEEGGGGDVEFSPDGQFLAAAVDHIVRLWNLKSRSERELSCVAPVRDLAFSPDSQRLATASTSEVIQLWDTTDPAPSQVALCSTLPGNSLAFRQDAEMLATGAAWKGKTVRFLDPKTLLPLLTPLPRIPAGIQALAFAPSSGLLAYATDEVQLWDTDAGRSMPIRFPSAYVHRLVFGPAGYHLAMASSDGTATVCDAATGKLVVPPLRHRADVVSVAFHGRGHLVATGSYDGTARIWDLRDQSSAHSVRLAHPGEVRGVAFHPDGNLLATTCADGIVRLWPIPLDSVSLSEMRLKTWVALGAQLNDKGEVEAIAGEDWWRLPKPVVNSSRTRDGENIAIEISQRSAAVQRVYRAVELHYRQAKPELAEREYLTAITDLDQLSEAYPSDSVCRYHLGRALAWLGRVQWWQLHKFNQSQVHLNRALDVQGSLCEQFPEVAAYVDEFAATKCELALIFQTVRRTSEALLLLEEAASLQRKICQESPNHNGYWQNLARIQMLHGLCLYETKQCERSSESYLAALEIQRRLVLERPEEDDFATELARCLGELNRVLQALRVPRTSPRYDRLTKALSALKARCAQRQTDAISSRERAQVARGHMQLALLQQGLGRTDEAIESYRAAHAHYERVVVESPDLDTYQALAEATEQLAKILHSKELSGSARSGKLRSPEKVEGNRRTLSTGDIQ